MISIGEAVALVIEDLVLDWRCRQTIINTDPALDLAAIEKARLVTAERTLTAILQAHEEAEVIRLPAVQPIHPRLDPLQMRLDAVHALIDPPEHSRGVAGDLFKHANPCFDAVSHAVGFLRPVVRDASGGFGPASASRNLAQDADAAKPAWDGNGWPPPEDFWP